MIVRMSKAEIVGPKNLLLQVLAAIQELEIVHIEPAHRTFRDETEHGAVSSLAPDEKIIAEQATLENLMVKIDELTSLLPQVESGRMLLKAEDSIDSVRYEVEKHLESCRGWCRKRELLLEEQAELDRHAIFIEALESLLAGAQNPQLVEFIGITLKNKEAVDYLRILMERVTGGSFEMFVTTARDTSLVILLVVSQDMAHRVKELLSVEAIPELVLPKASSLMSMRERIEYLTKRRIEIADELAETEQALRQFAHHWLAIYKEQRDWIGRRHELLKTTSSLFETGHCFFLYGWMPADTVATLNDKLRKSFGGRIMVTEREIQRKELDDVPVLLHNSPYFEPFEVFSRLLPLPIYSSFDPTIFIGIFFPIFFGLILGDAGYGLLLIGIAFLCRRVFRIRPLVKSLASILLISSIYTTLFGFVFGEFLGELGQVWLGLHPVWMSRGEAVIPMLLFSISVGTCHVLLGLILGVLAALRKGGTGEALFKFANILVVLSLVTFFIVRNFHVPHGVHQALVVTVTLTVAMAVIGGGLLAPLELIKSIGNIISYARIMAIGLASVLLATVANVLGGMTGDVLTGILIGGLFHAINIILGVIAPTIQSLRLHFVEFFSKFMEHGGKEYRPFK